MTLCVRAARILGLVSMAGASTCHKSDTPSRGATEQTVTSETGSFRVTARPVRVPQKQALDLTVTLAVVDSSTLAPLDGLDWKAAAFMPSMGHGTSIVPEVHPQRDGVYRVEHINLFMPGTWELRATASGTRTDKVAVQIEVVQ